jgi:predicted permease
LGASVDAWQLRKEEWGLAMFRQEMKYAARRLRRAPLFTIMAVVTLALGIGANTAVFSVVRNVVLAPLPYENPERLVMLWEQNLERGWEFFTVSPANFVDWRERSESFGDLSAVTSARMTLTGHGDPERVPLAAVSTSFFPIMAAAPFVGRTFTANEGTPGEGNVVVLSHGLWQRLFGGDPGALGRSIVLDGASYEIVGIAPETLAYPASAQMWIPLIFDFDLSGARGAHYLRVVGRLADRATLSGARAEMAALANSLASEFPNTNQGWGARVDGFRDMILGDRIPQTLYVLWAAVGFVILIACVNLTNLFLARTSAQRVEFAVRTALGAGRRRLVRQMFVESLLVSVIGLLVGVVLGEVAVRALVALNPVNLPRLREVEVDGVVLAMSAGLTLGIAFIVGLVPAVHGVNTGLFSAVRETGVAGGPAASHRIRSVLVVLQVAVAVVVVVGSGVVLRSLWRLQAVDPGFQVEGVAVFDVAPPPDRYPEYPQLRELHTNVQRDLMSLPGVTDAGLTNILPLHGDIRFAFSPVSVDLASDQEPSGLMRSVTPGYFAAVGISLIRGRLFDATDRGDRPVMVINQSLATQYFANVDPIGQLVEVGYGDAQCPCEVVGVVGDVQQGNLGAPTEPGYYFPYAQTGWRSVSVVVRTTTDPESLLPAIRSVVARHDPDLAIDNLGTLSDRVAATIAQPRFNALLLASFGAVSLILAVVGVYGIMAFAVNARIREIGLRIALGATGSRVAARVVRQGLAITGIGIALGTLAAFGVTRFLAVMVFEVRPFDPLTVVTVAALLAACGFMSSYLPARRAANVDPIVALRSGE